MPKVPRPRNHHRHSALIRGGYHFVVAYAAAGLNDRCGAGVGDHVQAIAEGKERIGSDCGVSEGEPGVLRLDRGDPGRIYAAHLARADSERHAVAAEDDCV